MGNKRWIPCGAASLLIAACAFCALLLTLVSGASPAFEAPHDQTTQGQQSSGETGIQILDRRFDAVEIAQGRQIYLQNCAACHGADAQGQFPEAPLEPDSTGRIGAPPHNDTGHTWHHSDVLLIRYVTEGGFSDLTRFYLMPPFGDLLTDEQILFVLAYIKTLWTDEQRENQRRLTEEEQRMFSE